MEPWYGSIEITHNINGYTMDSQLLTVDSKQLMTAL